MTALQEFIEESRKYTVLLYKKDVIGYDFLCKSFLEIEKQQIIDAKDIEKGLKFTEQDMIDFAWFLLENIGQYSCDRTAHFEGKYLEQFKNK